MTIWVVGRGLVGKRLIEEMAKHTWVNTASNNFVIASVAPESIHWLGCGDLVVLCTDGMKSADLVAKIDPLIPVLDMSPTFRGHVDWVYGTPNVHKTRGWSKMRVANPGCMATAAILMLEPLVELCMIDIRASYYLDTVIGYSAGGMKMVKKYEGFDPPTEHIGTLAKTHLHVPEIKYATGITGDVVLAPKVANFFSGIRMQVLIPLVKREDLLEAYEYIYNGTNITVDRSVPNKILGDEWANKSGACIRVFQHGESCLVVCTMDNLKLGAVDNAIANMKWMLGTK
jgi:N-acetyl-gamma-glutamyl-phosphate reductase